MNQSGIYKILNIINGKFYIGSAVNFSQRWRAHKSLLNRNMHLNPYLQNAWNKYGADNFKFEIVEHCNIDKLIEWEQFYIDNLKPEYNLCLVANSRKGIKSSDESRLKMSLSQKLRFQDETQKITRNLILKGNNFRKNKKASIETRKNISLGKMGHSVSEETRLKISLGNKGRKRSPEQIVRLTLARRKRMFQDANV